MKTRIQKILSLCLLGVGWLAIMANSAGPHVDRVATEKTGTVSIENAYASGCFPDVYLGAPVHRVVWHFNGSQVLELECDDALDCLTSAFTDCHATFDPPDQGSGELDSGAGGSSKVTMPPVHCTPEKGADSVSSFEKCAGQVVVKAYTLDGAESTQAWKQVYEHGGYGCSLLRF